MPAASQVRNVAGCMSSRRASSPTVSGEPWNAVGAGVTAERGRTAAGGASAGAGVVEALEVAAEGGGDAVVLGGVWRGPIAGVAAGGAERGGAVGAWRWLAVGGASAGAEVVSAPRV